MRRFSRCTQHAARLVRIRARMRFGTLALVVFAAALVAPLAQADKWGTSAGGYSIGVNPRPDDRGGPRGSVPSAAPGLGPHHSGVRPDDAAGPRGLSVPISTGTIARTKIVTVRIDGFQWLDAALGAALATVVLLASGTLSAVVLRRRTSARPV
jgi:hypothetical protein